MTVVRDAGVILVCAFLASFLLAWFEACGIVQDKHDAWRCGRSECDHRACKRNRKRQAIR